MSPLSWSDRLHEFRVDMVVGNHVFEFVDLLFCEGVEEHLLFLVCVLLAVVFGIDVAVFRHERAHMRTEESDFVSQVSCTQGFQSRDTGIECFCGGGHSTRPHRHWFHSRKTELGHVWNNNLCSCESALVTWLCSFDQLATQNHVHCSWHRSSGDLVGVFLDTHFLPVHKGGFGDVQGPGSVVFTCRVGTTGWLCVFERLFHVLNQSLANITSKRSFVQFWSDFTGTGDCSRDGHEHSNVFCPQFSDSVDRGQVVERDLQNTFGHACFFVLGDFRRPSQQSRLVFLDHGPQSVHQVREESVVLFCDGACQDPVFHGQ
ncbi:hypothetical protein OGAPHI_007122 [Ogataea philodendri]|uniref:Uncharacterized protein n=1 Tax=Ogataea philodendri TaxID=1378263 RepID=A0A9P8NWJ1_9ASCO|nr:uncharacterized protein OGAPHI_007122 [Ogataea philodendri]KAH3660536.1 hypothetical protein OGAPHI_007122 [Ogataea philodendri]